MSRTRVLSIFLALSSSLASATTPPAVLNLADYNAVCDGQANDSPALEAAKAAQANVAATTYQVPIYVPPPSTAGGCCRLNSGVTFLNGSDQRVRLTGGGLASVICLASSDQAGLTFANLSDAEVDHAVIRSATGGGAGHPDWAIVGSNSTLRVHDVTFTNLTTNVGTVENADGSIRVEGNRFSDSVSFGTTATSSYVACVKNGMGVGFSDCVVVGNRFGDNPEFNAVRPHGVYLGDARSYPATLLAAGFDPVAGKYELNASGQGGYLTPTRHANADGATVVVSDNRFIRGFSGAAIDFEPTSSRYRDVEIDRNLIAISDVFPGPLAIHLKQYDAARLRGNWSGQGGVGGHAASFGIDVVNGGRTEIVDVILTGDDFYRHPVTGSTVIHCDVSTASLTVVGGEYETIEAECPTEVVFADGTRARMYKGAAVAANTLVKLAPSGVVVTLGKDDARSQLLGVAVQGTARATLLVKFNAAIDVVENDAFQVSDGVNAARYLSATLSGQPGKYPISNAWPADQRAASLGNLVNSLYGPSFRIQALSVVPGSGTVVLQNDTEGVAGDRVVGWATDAIVGSVSANAGAITAIGFSGGRSYVPVQSHGLACVVDDGTSGEEALVPGAVMGVSAFADGAVRVDSTRAVGILKERRGNLDCLILN